jgi:lipopolysaccharide/colanic/teichoic acid biosynthesis glycosyltransferase
VRRRRLCRGPSSFWPRATNASPAGEAFVAEEGNPSAAYRCAKRLVDIVGAIALLAVLWPVLLATYVALWVTTRGKPVFRQVRLGLGGRPFMLYKFRTMTLDAASRQHEVVNEKDGPIFKNRRDPRITRLGRILRKTSIDEMPQLFNVLKGDMSLVGPRPPVPAEVARYRPWQRRRLSVKPGLTCLWQVSGRSEVGFEDWVRMDLWYVRHQSLAVDMKLLAKTPWVVLTGRGAY